MTKQRRTPGALQVDHHEGEVRRLLRGWSSALGSNGWVPLVLLLGVAAVGCGSSPQPATDDTSSTVGGVGTGGTGAGVGLGGSGAGTGGVGTGGVGTAGGVSTGGVGTGGAGAGSSGGGGAGHAEIVAYVVDVDVSTLAGSASSGAVDGVGAEALFHNPVNVAVDPAGDLVVSDFDNHRLRKVSQDGTVTTLLSTADHPGLYRPFGLAFGAPGELFLQTDGNLQSQSDHTTGTVWRVDLVGGGAVVIAENIGRPRGLIYQAPDAEHPQGQLVLVDPAAHTVRLLDLDSGEISLVAGAPAPGFVDGAGSAALFRNPYGAVEIDPGVILVADMGNHSLRTVDLSTGEVSTFAGDGSPGMVDGQLMDARFDHPKDVAVDSLGNLYVSDTGNHRIRRIDSVGIVETVAGVGEAGFMDGAGQDAQFFGQEGLDVLLDGSKLFVADGTDGEIEPFHRVRQILLP